MVKTQSTNVKAEDNGQRWNDSPPASRVCLCDGRGVQTRGHGWRQRWVSKSNPFSSPYVSVGVVPEHTEPSSDSELEHTDTTSHVVPQVTTRKLVNGESLLKNSEFQEDDDDNASPVNQDQASQAPAIASEVTSITSQDSVIASQVTLSTAIKRKQDASFQPIASQDSQVASQVTQASSQVVQPTSQLKLTARKRITSNIFPTIKTNKITNSTLWICV